MSSFQCNNFTLAKNFLRGELEASRGVDLRLLERWTWGFQRSGLGYKESNLWMFQSNLIRQLARKIKYIEKYSQSNMLLQSPNNVHENLKLLLKISRKRRDQKNVTKRHNWEKSCVCDCELDFDCTWIGLKNSFYTLDPGFDYTKIGLDNYFIQLELAWQVFYQMQWCYAVLQ